MLDLYLLVLPFTFVVSAAILIYLVVNERERSRHLGNSTVRSTVAAERQRRRF